MKKDKTMGGSERRCPPRLIVYGQGPLDPLPLQIELQQVQERLKRLREAEERELEADSRERIKRAVTAQFQNRKSRKLKPNSKRNIRKSSPQQKKKRVSCRSSLKTSRVMARKPAKKVRLFLI